jgi:hypothetical protein
MFTVLETQKLLDGNARLTLVPQSRGQLTPLLAAKETPVIFKETQPKA